MKWRVIITDSESLTGVAPVCDNQNGDGHGVNWVRDCCPYPHLETYSEIKAPALAAVLTDMDVEECS